MFIEKWGIARAVVVVFALLLLLWISRKQVRALRYCFMHFSDALKREIDDNQYLLDRPDSEVISGVMKGLTRIWGGELDWAKEVMTRAHLSWFSERDKFYVLED